MDDPHMDPLESQLYAMKVMRMSNTMPAGIGMSSLSSWHHSAEDDSPTQGGKRFPGNQPPPPGHDLFRSAEMTRRLPSHSEVSTTPGWKIGLYSSQEDDKFGSRNKQPLPPGEEDRETRESSLGSREWDYKRYPQDPHKESPQTASSDKGRGPQLSTQVSSVPPPRKEVKEPAGLNSHKRRRNRGRVKRKGDNKELVVQKTEQPTSPEQPPSKEQKENESLWDSLASLDYLRKDTRRSDRKKFFERKRKMDEERAKKAISSQNRGISDERNNQPKRKDSRRSPVPRDLWKRKDKGMDEDRRGSSGATVGWGQSSQHEQRYARRLDVWSPDHKDSGDKETHDRWKSGEPQSRHDMALSNQRNQGPFFGEEYHPGSSRSSSQMPKFPRKERDATGERSRSEIQQSMDDRWSRGRQSVQRPREEHQRRHGEQVTGGFDDLSEQPMDLEDAEESAGNTQQGTSIPSLLDLDIVPTRDFFQGASDTDMRKQTAPAVEQMKYSIAEDAGYPFNQEEFFISSRSREHEQLYGKRGQSTERVRHKQLLQQVGGAVSRCEENLFPPTGDDRPRLDAQTEPHSAAGVISESFSETPLDQFSADALANPFSAGTSTSLLYPSTTTIPFLAEAPSSQNVVGTVSSLTFGGSLSNQSLPGPLINSTLPQEDLSRMNRSSISRAPSSSGVQPAPGAGSDPAVQPTLPVSSASEELDDRNNKVVGAQYIIPVTGFFCKVCSKFFNTKRLAYEVHCKSNKHINKTYTRMKHDSLLQQHQASKAAKGLLVKFFVNDTSNEREVSTKASHTQLLKGSDKQQLLAVPLPDRPRDKRLTEELLKEQIQHGVNPQAELLAEQQKQEEAAMEEERQRQERERLEREMQERLEKEKHAKAEKIKEMEMLEVRMKEEQQKIERLKEEEMKLVQAEREKQEREERKQELLRVEEEERLKKEQILRAEEDIVRQRMLEIQREQEKLYFVQKCLEDEMLMEEQVHVELQRYAAEKERADVARRAMEEGAFPEIMDAPPLDSHSSISNDTGHNRTYFSQTSGAARRRRARALRDSTQDLPPRVEPWVPADQEGLDRRGTDDWSYKRRGRGRGDRRSADTHDRELPGPGACPPPFHSRSPSSRPKSPSRKSPVRQSPARRTSSRKSPVQRGPAKSSTGRFSSMQRSRESTSPVRRSRGSASPLRRPHGGTSPGQISTVRSSREISPVKRSPPRTSPAKSHATIPPAEVLSDRESLEGDISGDELIDFGEGFNVVDEVSG